MRWKKFITGILAAVLAASAVSQAVPVAVSAAGQEGSYTVSAPTEDLQIEFWLDAAGAPYYQVVRNGVELIEDSKLGLNTSLGVLNTGLSLKGEPVTASGESTWEPVVGEQAVIRDRWNETAFTLENGAGLRFGIVMRAYDEGVAFRYILPENAASYTVSDEYTQFVFQAGATASLHVGNNQTMPGKYAVESLPSNPVQRPATVEFTDGQILTICEANLENYAVMTMSKSGTARAFEANLCSSVTVDPAGGPVASPWRVLVMGDEPTDLLENDIIIQNLNEPADEETYGFSEWLDPGTCVRATTGLNNTAIKGVIDLAAEHGIRYVLLDSGWYGPEYDPNADPRLDPAALDPDNAKDQILLEKYFATTGGFNNTGEGVFNTNGNGFNQYGSLGDGGSMQVNVDIPALCEYANARGVGIVLYVNKVFLPDTSKDASGNLRNRFTVDELFAYFEKWGVAGVKPGFVNVRTQQYEAYMEEVIEAAARHKLVMTVHDEYVTTGQERTYPNLMMTEGILGDEGIGRNSPCAAEDITTIFTRNVQGPPDHTFCYPGKATKAYALASPILFRSGMSVLYWYTNPGMVPAQDKDKLKIWDDMPTNWDESLFLEGALYEYATTARRAGDAWYVGSLSAVTRTLQIPLSFLDEGMTYVAQIYADGIDADPYAGWTTSATAAKSLQTLDIKKVLVTSETVLQRDLDYGFGYAVMLTPATAEEIAALDDYSVYRQELELEIARCADITEGDYTAESYGAFETALAAAEAALADKNSSDANLEKVLSDLQSARMLLVSTESLDAAIANTAYYTSYHYTQDSFAAVTNAVAAAQALLEGKNFTQKDLDDAEAAIAAALEGLTADPDRVLKKTIYLDELSYDTANSYAHAGAIKKKTDYYGSTLSLMVDGTEQIFERGMSTHAQSELYYNIDGLDLQIFEAYVGVDTAKPTQGNVIFRVYGDDVLLYESAASGTGSQNAQYFSIPIAGVKQLHLEANMAGTNDGDHAVWADAKFLTYRDPDAYLDAITLDGEALSGFDQELYEYLVYAPDPDRIPVAAAVPAEADVACSVKQAAAVPGCAEIQVARRDGSVVTYRIYMLPTEDSDYISDLPNSLILENTLYGLNKDSVQGNKLALTGADGTSRVDYAKGLGTHAKTGTTSRVVYNIEGRGYDRFQGYVGISYIKAQSDTRPSVNFKIYVDDETTPRFESGKMLYNTPQMFYNVDVSGAKKLILVADACGDQSADHGCWCDAKFLKYTGVQTVSGSVDVNNTGLELSGIAVNLYAIVNDAVQDTPVKTAVTDENGTCTFANVLAGNYLLQVEQGQNHLAASAEIQVADEAVEQDLILQAPEYEIEILQSKDAIVLVDDPAAVRDALITVFVKDITPGMKLEAVTVTAEDGSDIEVTAAEGNYTFTMPAQKVTVQVALTEDTQAAADIAAAGQIDEKILAVGEVTPEKREEIENIRAEYEQLSDSAKAYVEKLALLEHYEFLLENMEIQDGAEAAQAAAEAARNAAETAQAAAEAAEKAAREAADSAAADKTAAEAAQAAADQAKQLAENAQAAAEAAQEAAENANVEAAKEAQAAAESAASAADAAATAAEAAQAAQAAQGAAEAAQATAEEAAASSAEDKKAAEAARMAAEAAQAQADAAKAAAEAAQAAAEVAAAAAEQSNTEAAAEAALSAASAAASAESAQAAAASALTAAEAAKAAQEAQKAAEDAASQTASDKAAVEKAKEEAEKAAAQVMLSVARYDAMVKLNEHADALKKDASEVSLEALTEAVEAAREAINNAEDEEAIAEALQEGKEALDVAVCPAKNFTDVDLDAWYHDAVDYVLQEGIMNGNGDGTFAPNAALSRAMLVQILYNVAGRPQVETDVTFSDVKADAWYYDAVMWAAEEGVVKGYDNGTFGAEDDVTREQMVTIMWRYAGEPECTAQEIVFADSDQISDWAKDAVMWAYEVGIVQGVGDDMFDPAGNSIRAAAAQIMMNYFSK